MIATNAAIEHYKLIPDGYRDVVRWQQRGQKAVAESAILHSAIYNCTRFP
ncbi:hypothetical protein [Zunongwangia pacifica]|uniref:Uncharacterized protein n=1 Tax=Zunongwangia pacifica TaxID=2911062 RepID=A0A9X1ZX44_9FLAO|nr:hypothetical protein [Zunongwangia pacifica]MCL6220780.1 hypothetical protein [Zunongwangia pacifica]